jgi:hypothetical protein
MQKTIQRTVRMPSSSPSPQVKFLSLSLPERRRLLAQQAEDMLTRYGPPGGSCSHLLLLKTHVRLNGAKTG